MFIGPIERLSEDELPCVGVVANVEPVADAAPYGGDSLVNLCSGGAAVHATDDQVEIVMQIVAPWPDAAGLPASRVPKTGSGG